MIIMINGSFGVGKTSVAQELVRRLPNTLLFDPELVGGLVRMLTEGIRTAEEDTDDFQDIVLWRQLTVTTATSLYQQYGCTLVIPMTIVQPEYLEFIQCGVAQIAPLYHFSLTASLDTIRQRLLQRGDGPDSWAWRKATLYAPLFANARFRERVQTEGRTVGSIVDEIVSYLPGQTGDTARQLAKR